MPGALRPLTFPYRSTTFTRDVGTSSETINADISSMELPFENKLKQYVVANDENVSSLISDMKSLLANLKDLNISAATMLLDPSVYNVAYTSTLLTNLTTEVTSNLADTGTGITTATETAMIDRARARVNFDGSREARRILQMNAKMMPYAGRNSVLLKESDRTHIMALNDMNWRITEKQSDMTYAFNRAKVQESLSLENLKITEKHQRLAQHLQAMIADDENSIRQKWNEYDVKIRRALGHVQFGIDFALKAASGADQITFENYLEMSKIMADGQLEIAASVANLLPSAQSV